MIGVSQAGKLLNVPLFMFDFSCFVQVHATLVRSWQPVHVKKLCEHEVALLEAFSCCLHEL